MIKLSSFKFRLFLIKKLPLAYIAGLKLVTISDQLCKTKMRFSYINQNPFRSMYFAAMFMGAEMTTGLPLFLKIKEAKLKMSMLLVETHASFQKKAVGMIYYVCDDLPKFLKEMEDLNVGESTQLRMPSKAYNESDELLAEFELVWSLKRKE